MLPVTMRTGEPHRFAHFPAPGFLPSAHVRLPVRADWLRAVEAGAAHALFLSLVGDWREREHHGSRGGLAGTGRCAVRLRV